MLSRSFANADWKFTVIAGASVVACPLIWNIVARNEYRNKTLTKLMGDSPQRGCYALAAWIFLSSLVRDKLIEVAIQKSKPSTIPCLEGYSPSTRRTAAKALLAAGLGLVAASYYRLGITYTYLGDYFGLLMDKPVTEFPFSVIPDPMYTGASIGFAALAIHEDSPVGLLLSAWCYAVYKVSTVFFEDPFTAKIYAEKAKKDAATAAAAAAATSSSTTAEAPAAAPVKKEC